MSKALSAEGRFDRSGVARPTVARLIMRHGAALALVTALVFAMGCEGRAAPASDEHEARAVAAPPESPGRAPGLALAASGRIERMSGITGDDDEGPGAPGPEGPTLRGRAVGEGHRPGGVAAASDEKGDEEGEEDEEDEDEKGYWKDVQFTQENFDEVRRFVKIHYIDDIVDEKRAYIEATNFALMSLEDQPLEILPESFYQLRRDNPDEEGRLAGKIFKLRPRDRFVVHEIPKDVAKKEARRRLSDYEIRQLRLREKARFALLERHWGELAFGERDFQSLMDEARRRGRKNPEFRPSDLYVAAASGYLYSLDPHSSLVSAKAWEESTKQTEDASFDGIGAVLTQRDNQTLVESPIEGQPAVRAGLRAGDVILMVDRKEIAGLPLFKVVKRIRGPRGTQVTLTIRREGVPDDMQVVITRSHIDIKNVSGHMLKAPFEDVGYIKLTGFVRTSTQKFEEMVNELTRQTSSGRLRGLVFDLRNNNGGLLSQGISLADRFLTDGVIVSVRNKPGLTGESDLARDEVYRATPDLLVTCPVVVLVNDATASAAEIVASALQENQRAIVLGDRTFGKASVQTLYPPPGQKDYFIKLTVARYYSPAGRTIQLTGVEPDETVAPEVDGSMPLGFREENLRNPLSQQKAHYRSPWAERLPRIEECVRDHGQAEALHKADPNPAIKFDLQLMKGADFVECLIREQAERQAGQGAPPAR